MRIGVAISTMNRRDLLERALEHWEKFIPDGSVLVIVDDASTDPSIKIPASDRYETVLTVNSRRMGIAATKNKCIAELMDAGCDHLFLVDDDVWPVTADWWKPYVESSEPHLSFQWPRAGAGHRWVIKHTDDQHFSIGFPRGVMLYAERRVIDRVGGMDTAYGAHGGEHVEWSQRIHNAKLTRWPFADVRHSDKLWYSFDKENGGATGSTFSLNERRKMSVNNGRLWNKTYPNYYFDYREGEGVQDYSLGVRLSGTYEGTLQHVLGLHPFGVALEFGVGEGNSLERIANHMPVYGFDSFEGLPEDWREGFEAGRFACTPPLYVRNATIIKGLFEDTLPTFKLDKPVGLIHLDADLYSSTKTVLDYCEKYGWIKPGVYIVFDEYHGYPGAEGEHEQKAWREFADRTGVNWTVIGKGPEQWAIRIT